MRQPIPYARCGRPRAAVVLGAALLLIGRVAGAAEAPGVGTDRVRLACSFAAAAGVAKIPETGKFCEVARTALKDLAVGRLDEPVTRFPPWAATVEPGAEQECRQAAGLNAAGSCERERFRLMHPRESLSIVPVDLATVAIAEPGAVTAIVKGQAAADPAFGRRELRVSLKIIAVANDAAREVELFQSERAIEVEPGTDAAASLHTGLQLLWAGYFTPYVVNHIIANAMAAKAGRR